MPGIRGVWRLFSRDGARTELAADDSPHAGEAAEASWRCAAGKAGRAITKVYKDYLQRLAQAREVRRHIAMAQQEASVLTPRRAQRRALMLLLGLLSPQQRQEFSRKRYFHVTGGSTGTVYRIRAGVVANIDVLDAAGNVKHRLCFHPIGGVPLYDVMAAQVLYLQDPDAEQRVLHQAIVHYPSTATEVRIAFSAP